MANSDFSKLSDRNQSKLVSDIYKEISSFTESFPLRKRVYIRDMSKMPNNIYWLQDSSSKLAAFAFLDSNYIFKIGNIQLHTFSHTIAKKPGYMNRLLSHIFEERKEQDLILICKDFVYNTFNITNDIFIPLNPDQLEERWSELATLKTDFFGANEDFLSGVKRKKQMVYLKLTSNTKKQLNF